MKLNLNLALLTLVAASCGTPENNAGDQSPDAEVSKTASVTNTAYPEKVYWGDTHLHSGWSADAGASGTRIGPEETVRFAMGEEVKSDMGLMAKLHRPLDWVCLTDHSDGMGLIAGIIDGDPELMTDAVLKKWHDDMASGDPARANAVMMDIIRRQSTNTLPSQATDTTYSRSVWERNNAIMDKYYKPGTFTPFIAYEWTSNYKGGNNMHRNIIYRGNAKEANQVLPFTTFQSEDPEGLWQWMEAYEKRTAGKILAIPHNGNLSNGYMFAHTTLAGKPLSKEYADARNKWEVLYEASQLKGTSEAHPSLSPTDEFANFEIWDQGNLNLEPKKKGDINTEYIREALKDGLKFGQQLGTNPFKLGMAGGSDAHTGLTAMEEDNFFGKFVSSGPTKDRWNENAFDFDGKIIKGWELGATGWTGVWATSNTREALWDAMKRKETYATTGPRITLRFFGGFDYTTADINAANMAELGYKKGVPMGGDLSSNTAGKAPNFIIHAVKDPMGVNLDRVQVVKGWIDAKGNKQEKIFEVVWGDADKRKLDDKGKLPAVGNTVDLATCKVANTIGAAELKTVWTDPEFDAALPAFYYVRVLEIPSPRWTAYDAMRFKIKMDPNVTMTIQERCYSSPIWYTPAR